MAMVRQVFVPRLKLIVALGATLLFVAGCSNAPACAEGNTSDACRVRGGVDQIGSIVPRAPYHDPVVYRNPPQYRDTTGSIARPVIARPETVYVQPYPQQATYAPAMSQREAQRLARLRNAAICETTASIPRATVPRYTVAPRHTAASRYIETTASIGNATQPSITTMPARSLWHVVLPGETLTGIARRYKVSVVDIARFNELRDFPQIRSGTTILIPLS
jgi:hypothetical protein